MQARDVDFIFPDLFKMDAKAYELTSYIPRSSGVFFFYNKHRADFTDNCNDRCELDHQETAILGGSSAPPSPLAGRNYVTSSIYDIE